MQKTHTKKVKRFPDLYYFFTCGYDVNKPGTTCPVADLIYQMPKIPRYEAHMYVNHGASMVVQQKSLKDGTGEGMGWILENRTSKEQFVMQRQQEFTKKHQQKQLYQPRQQNYCGHGRNTQQ